MSIAAKRLLLRNTAFAAAILLAGASALGAASGEPAAVRMLAALAVALFIPGLLLGEMIFRRDEFGLFELIPLRLCLSVGMVFAPVLVAGFALHASFQSVAVAFLCACALLLAADTALLLAAPDRRAVARPESGPWAYALTALLFLSSVWALWLGGGIFGDAHNHLAFIRKMKEMPVLVFGRDVHFRELTACVHGVGLWNGTVALVAQLSGLGILDVWSRLPFVIVPVTILSFFAFARNLFDRDEPAYLSTFVSIAWFGVLNIDPLSKQENIFAVWSQFHWPSMVTRGIFFPATLLFVFRFLKERSPRYLVAGALFALFTSLCYVPYFLNLEFCLAAFLVCTVAFAARRREDALNLTKALLLITLTSGLYAFPLMRSLLPVVNPAYAAQGAIEGYEHYTLILPGGWPLINPERLVWPNLLFVFSMILTPFLLLYRGARGPRYLFAVSAAVLGVALNPPLLAVLRRSDESLHRIWRLTELYPFPLILGFFLWELGGVLRERWRSETRWIRVLAGAMFAVLLAAMAVQPMARQTKLRADRVNALAAVPSVERAWKSGALRGTAGSVTLVEGVTGAVWPVYFPHFILETYGSICSPIIDPTPRAKATWRVYDPATPMDETERLLGLYAVDFVAVNGDREKAFRAHGLDIGKVKEKFASRPGLFSKVYDDGTLSVYRYRSPVGGRS